MILVIQYKLGGLAVNTLTRCAGGPGFDPMMEDPKRMMVLSFYKFYPLHILLISEKKSPYPVQQPSPYPVQPSPYSVQSSPYPVQPSHPDQAYGNPAYDPAPPYPGSGDGTYVPPPPGTVITVDSSGQVLSNDTINTDMDTESKYFLYMLDSCLSNLVEI